MDILAVIADGVKPEEKTSVKEETPETPVVHMPFFAKFKELQVE